MRPVAVEAPDRKPMLLYLAGTIVHACLAVCNSVYMSARCLQGLTALATQSSHSCQAWLVLVLISGKARTTLSWSPYHICLSCSKRRPRHSSCGYVHQFSRKPVHRSLYITMDDRSSWEGLTAQVIPLMRQLTTRPEGPRRRLTIVAESFGGCLAFRLALAVPDLIEHMVVVNSATCFDKSYSGIVNLIAASNLLSLFPQQLYQVPDSAAHCHADSCRIHTVLQSTLLRTVLSSRTANTER